MRAAYHQGSPPCWRLAIQRSGRSPDYVLSQISTFPFLPRSIHSQHVYMKPGCALRVELGEFSTARSILSLVTCFKAQFGVLRRKLRRQTCVLLAPYTGHALSASYGGGFQAASTASSFQLSVLIVNSTLGFGPVIAEEDDV